MSNKREDMLPIAIGEIGNYYGGLMVKIENERGYWAIENWDGQTWQEIPDYLLDALLRFSEVAV